MKRYLKRILSCVLAVCMVMTMVLHADGGVTAEASDTVEVTLEDADFESGASYTYWSGDWSGSSSWPSYSNSTWQTHNGSYCEWLGQPGSTGTLVFYQSVSLSAGTYTLSGYTKIETSGVTVSAYLGGLTATSSTSVSSGSSWTQFEGTFIVDSAGTYEVGVSLEFTSTSGAAYLDDISLTGVVEDGAEVVTYGVSVSLDKSEIEAGNSVTATATVTKNGEAITEDEFTALGYYIYIELDDANGTYLQMSDNNGSNGGRALSDTITVSDTGTYRVLVKLEDTGWNVLDTATADLTVVEAGSSGGDDNSGSDDEITYTVALSVSPSAPVAGEQITLNATVYANGTTLTESEWNNLGYYLYFSINDGTNYFDPDINNGSTLTDTITLSTAGTYWITAKLEDDIYADVASDWTEITVQEEGSESYSVSFDVSNTTVEADGSVTLTATVMQGSTPVTDLSTAGLYLWVWADDGASTDCSISPSDGTALTLTVTFYSEGTYNLKYNLQNSGYTNIIGNTDLATITVTEKFGGDDKDSYSEITIENGDFESSQDPARWSLSGWTSVQQDSYMTNDTTYFLNLWLNNDMAAEGSATYGVILSAGTYYFTFDLEGETGSSSLSAVVEDADGTTLAQVEETINATAYNHWITYQTTSFTLEEETTVYFTLSGTMSASAYGGLDNLKLYGTGSVEGYPDLSEELVDSLDCSYIRGMDVSTIITQYECGAEYYDLEGNQLETVQDFFNFLADCGVNWVRVRIWNDPTNSETGETYGGGNCDLENAIAIGQYATNAGMTVLVDFLYSDFWADPAKQTAP